MKKILFCVLGIALITFIGCTKDEPLPDADKDVTIVDDDIDPNRSTNVTIYGRAYDAHGNNGYDCRIYIDKISIYNERDIEVGTGAYVGDYLVPYNGSIVITYHAEYDGDYDNYVSEKKTDRYQVGTSKQMYIMIYCLWRGGDEPSELYSKVTNGTENY